MENEGKLKKYERTTHEQLQFFITFSKKYPNILKNSYGSKGHYIQDLWNQLADNLNDIRGPTRSADKWKECLKNRINQIRCRARKSMLGWNYRSVNSKKLNSKKKIKTSDEPIEADVNYTKEDKSSNPDGIIIKDEIPSIDLDSRDSNQSFLYMDMKTSNLHSNHFVTRESSDITQDHLRMLVAFVKQYGNVDSDIQHNIDLWNSIAESLNKVEGSTYSVEKWKDILVKWKSQFGTKEDNWSASNSADLEQDALHALKMLMVNGKSNPDPISKENDNVPTMEFQQPELSTHLKQEHTHENYPETMPSLSDNEDITTEENFLNRNRINCDEANSSISDKLHSNFERYPHSTSNCLPKDFMDLIRESICRRDERDERSIIQQELLTKSLEVLNKNLETLTSAIVKFNEKLDKL